VQISFSASPLLPRAATTIKDLLDCAARSKSATHSLGFVMFLVLAFQLRQRDLEFLVEPDFDWLTVRSLFRSS